MHHLLLDLLQYACLACNRIVIVVLRRQHPSSPVAWLGLGLPLVEGFHLTFEHEWAPLGVCVRLGEHVVPVVAFAPQHARVAHRSSFEFLVFLRLCLALFGA